MTQLQELIALANGVELGRVYRDKRGRLSLVYNEDWRNARYPFPLSLSMPLAATEHGHSAVEAFLWGLLPDNEAVLDRWARKFQVSARNPFALISHVGEDCAGAVQFVRSERLDACLHDEPEPTEWLDDVEVAKRLSELKRDHAAWRAPSDVGQFSLAGAQPKTALLLDEGKWGVPSGRTPTTHIFKPPTGAFDGHAENEHFCLALARCLGMPTASSKIMRFGDEIAIVIERYDRIRQDNALVRIHQEDICQACAVPPMRKYENDGGPGAKNIVELLRANSAKDEEDVTSFMEALAFNWLIAGTDAHAKNYSVLIGGGGMVRLAPFYDIASALPYEGLDFQKLKLAMKIGNEYRLRDIVGPSKWQKLAEAVRYEEDQLLDRIRDMSERMPDFAITTRDKMKNEGLEHEIIDRLCDCIVTRAGDCKRYL